MDPEQQGAAGRAAGEWPKIVILHGQGSGRLGRPPVNPGGQDQQGTMSTTSATRQGNGELKAEENKHGPEMWLRTTVTTRDGGQGHASET